MSKTTDRAVHPADEPGLSPANPPQPTRTWICKGCGASRTASAKLGRSSRRLRCSGGEGTTWHSPVTWDDDDYAEHANAATNTADLLRQVVHIELMFDRLGVRFDYGRQKERARLGHEVGHGWMEWHVTLADNLLLPERLKMLRAIWQALGSAGQDGEGCEWGQLDRYTVDPGDPGVRWLWYCWDPFPGSTVDDALAAGAALRAAYGAR